MRLPREGSRRRFALRNDINDSVIKMKQQIFGKNIVPSCIYCEHSKTEGDSQFCTVNKQLQNGKCKKFKYNPIMREPKGMAPLKEFDREEFTL